MTEFLKPDGSYDHEAADAERKRLGELPLDQRITEREVWTVNGHQLHVDVVNDIRGFHWRFYAAGADLEEIDWTSHYEGITVCEDELGNVYGYVTPYYEGYLRCEVPFLITYATKQS